MTLRTLINSTRPQPSVFLGRCLSLLADVRSLAQTKTERDNSLAQTEERDNSLALTETERDNSLDLCKMRENIVHPLLREIWDIWL